MCVCVCVGCGGAGVGKSGLFTSFCFLQKKKTPTYIAVYSIDMENGSPTANNDCLITLQLIPTKFALVHTYAKHPE